jgi:molybdenum-dependent DNA-binding transcriptional regulator ModE
MKLRDLHIALAVAEAGSMTRTAEELAVSYPVVSKTISELERTSQRAGAKVEESAGSHAIYVSRPEPVAAIIKKAAQA